MDSQQYEARTGLAREHPSTEREVGKKSTPSYCQCIDAERGRIGSL